MHPAEVNDHAILVVRAHADFLGGFYSRLLARDPSGCRVHVDRDGWHRPWSNLSASAASKALAAGHAARGGWHHCSSEELMRDEMVQAGLRVYAAPQAYMPFQRSAHVRVPNSRGAPAGPDRIVRCFHKYCQSRVAPLPDPPGMVRCAKLDLD